jgi:hypothetical protein
VGAFAYLRKIVEKEILKIVKELTSDGAEHSEEIKALLKKYHEKKQIGHLIDSIFPFLPHSLKYLDSNPLKILYGYLSEGIHNLSDEQCLDHAIKLDKLLQFTIKKLREEQNEGKEIREIMKGFQK